jgi:hypothetical protein
MKTQITVALPGREPRGGVLTTERAASSLGLPVVVCDWTVYGSADVLWIDGSPAARCAAARAGYRLREPNAPGPSAPHGYRDIP